MLVIESGEVLIPGDIDFGFDIGLPPKTAYACLAETALLAMEGRFEDYTLGATSRWSASGRIYRLFKKHQFPDRRTALPRWYVTDGWWPKARAGRSTSRRPGSLRPRAERVGGQTGDDTGLIQGREGRTKSRRVALGGRGGRGRGRRGAAAAPPQVGLMHLARFSTATALTPKSLGQNFLYDEGLLGRIVAAAELSPGDAVLEVGPGLGR